MFLYGIIYDYLPLIVYSDGGKGSNVVNSKTKQGNQGGKTHVKPLDGVNEGGNSGRTVNSSTKKDNQGGKGGKGGNVMFESNSKEAMEHHDKLLGFRKAQNENRKEIAALNASIKSSGITPEAQKELDNLREKDKNILKDRMAARKARDAAAAGPK